MKQKGIPLLRREGNIRGPFLFSREVSSPSQHNFGGSPLSGRHLRRYKEVKPSHRGRVPPYIFRCLGATKEINLRMVPYSGMRSFKLRPLAWTQEGEFGGVLLQKEFFHRMIGSRLAISTDSIRLFQIFFLGKYLRLEISPRCKGS